MTDFRALKNLCNKFEEEVKLISNEVFSSGVGENFDELVAKKLKNLGFFSAKAKLLQAKPLSLTQPPLEQDIEETALLTKYEETIQLKLIEHLTVKSVTQASAVKSLLTTPSSKLAPEFVNRKEKIIISLSDYRKKETELQALDSVMKEKEDELARARERWHKLVGDMRDLKTDDVQDAVDASGPYYSKMLSVCAKISIMRWLINCLVEPRTLRYDWLRDPKGRLAVIKLARPSCDITQFMQ